MCGAGPTSVLYTGELVGDIIIIHYTVAMVYLFLLFVVSVIDHYTFTTALISMSRRARKCHSLVKHTSNTFRCSQCEVYCICSSNEGFNTYCI